MSELAVILGDGVAGTPTRLSGARLRFDYADDYGAGTPLSLSMPVQVRLRVSTTSRNERPTHSPTPLVTRR